MNKVINGERVEMGASELAQFEASRAPTLASIKERIVSLMAEKQDGGIVFNGLPVATDPRAKAEIAGAKQKARASRKIVTRNGGGVKAELSQAQFDALHSAVEDYHQSVMDHAHDLLGQAEAAADPASVNIEAGWPSNVIDA